MAHLLADLRHAIRAWRKAPALTVIVLASLALGIGANTAIFTLVDQVLLRPLPIHDPGRLVQVTRAGAFYGGNWGDGSEISVPMYEHLRDHNQVFESMTARFATAVHVAFGGQTERVSSEVVSGSYFRTLGVGAAL
ncbi:MAG TPA: hypothetical protein VM386_01460, partial [Acidimicrobiales bacterium]|nr:hypothetical protein [Acidimicrobiales bacterium]